MIKIILYKIIVRMTIFKGTGKTITIIFQVTEIIIPTAIDTIITIIIIFWETEIMIINKKI